MRFLPFAPSVNAVRNIILGASMDYTDLPLSVVGHLTIYLQLTGLDLVEVSPSLDPSDITGTFASNMIRAAHCA